MRPIWVIYQTPTDFPSVPFVVRKHELRDGLVIPTPKTWKGESLSEARSHIPKGKVNMGRSEKDEPQIVEWWV